MHHKSIKLIIRKQLKKAFPNWKGLPKKMKREISNKVMAEVTANYDFKGFFISIKESLVPFYEAMGKPLGWWENYASCD